MYNKAAFFGISSRHQLNNERLTAKSVRDTRQFRVTGAEFRHKGVGGGVLRNLEVCNFYDDIHKMPSKGELE